MTKLRKTYGDILFICVRVYVVVVVVGGNGHILDLEENEMIGLREREVLKHQ